MVVIFSSTLLVLVVYLINALCSVSIWFEFLIFEMNT